MQAVLIPFLLAANISQNNDATWEHGALSKWKARANVLGENNVQRVFSVSGTFDMECRTKNEAKLICNASNFDFEEEDMYSVDKNEINETLPIEITFNNHGIEQITGSTVMYTSSTLLFLKKFVSLLNIGVDLGEMKDQLPLSTTALGVLGLCSCNYSIHEEVDDFILPTDMPRQHRDYELFFIPHPERKDGHLMTLEKHVDAMECDKNEGYFQMYPYGYMAGVPADSKSHSIAMKIADHGYFRIIGYTDGHYTLEEENGVNKLDITETLELALDNVEEATEPLVEIDNTTSFTVKFALKDLGKQNAHGGSDNLGSSSEIHTD